MGFGSADAGGVVGRVHGFRRDGSSNLGGGRAEQSQKGDARTGWQGKCRRIANPGNTG